MVDTTIPESDFMHSFSNFEVLDMNFIAACGSDIWVERFVEDILNY